MRQTTFLFAAAFGCLLGSAGNGFGATITNFTAAYSYSNTSNFSGTTPTIQNDGTTGTVTNTALACLSPVGCSGRVLDFSATVTGLTPTTPFTVAIDGTVDGSTPDGGTLTISSPLPATVPFTFGPNAFNKVIVSSSFPITGTTTISGFLSLTMAPSTTLNLPSSLTFSVASAAGTVPEPGSVLLLATGLGGVMLLVRRRTIRP